MNNPDEMELTHEAFEVLLRTMTFLLENVLDQIPDPERTSVRQTLIDRASESLERAQRLPQQERLPDKDLRAIRYVLNTLLSHVQSS